MKFTSKLFSLTLPLVLVLSLNVTSCASKKKTSAEETAGKASDKMSDLGSEGLTLELNGDSDSNKAGALRTVFFPFDSSEITGETKESLNQNAVFLKANPAVKVQVEGHCDERGSVEYNLALGERRARSVKDYLNALGITSDRVSTISYGKERPVSMGHDEDSWAKNRRANFVVTEK